MNNAGRSYSMTILVALVAALCSATPSHADDANAAASTPIADHYRDAAQRIINSTMAGNDAYIKMQELCDDIGHRLSGSPGLERAVRWAADAMKKDGQENVRLEPVMVPHWVRGRESLTMIAPRPYDIPMLGLGGSVGTPPGGITAEVVAVRDEADLEKLGEGARGKIVLFNNDMRITHPGKDWNYGTAVRYRSIGARLASEKGAVACVIRSAASDSMRTPHTGAMRYGDAKVKIPAAAMSTEDADMITRLCARGVPVKLTLKMEAKTLPDAESANVIGELRGSTWPDQVIVMGGHIDAWDVGQGAHDDAGGCVTAMEALNVLRKLNLRPKRTIRVVLWTNEENGLRGGKNYAEVHADELANHVAAIEMDGGTFRPVGYSVGCVDEKRQAIAIEQMRDILSLLSSFGATRVRTGGGGADINPMKGSGLITMHHEVDNGKYFHYHHSPADTLDKIDPTELSQNVATMATVSYILADMPQRLGHLAGTTD